VLRVLKHVLRSPNRCFPMIQAHLVDSMHEYWMNMCFNPRCGAYCLCTASAGVEWDDLPLKYGVTLRRTILPNSTHRTHIWYLVPATVNSLRKAVQTRRATAPSCTTGPGPTDSHGAPAMSMSDVRFALLITEASSVLLLRPRATIVLNPLL
jgi:hypothetical protein